MVQSSFYLIFVGNANCRKKDLKVVQLNDSVFKEVCVQLEIYPELHDKNWKGLAGKLGYSATQVKVGSKTKSLIRNM